MTSQDLMREVRNMLDQVKSAVLATIDPEGRPHMRWMNPVMVRGVENVLYAVTSTDSPKISHLKNNAGVEWMIQPLSCDHRVIDGAVGAEFLNDLKGMMEDPVRTLY